MAVMSRSRLGSGCAPALPATLSPARPKGDQLREVLERLAAELGPGQPIPSERYLAEHFGIARGTARQVIAQLVADGVLFRRPGTATFTAHPPSSDMITSFTADVLARGLVPATVLLSTQVLPADAELAARLEVPPHAPVFRLERLRLVNGEPLAVERTNVPVRRFPGIEVLDWQTRSLHQTLWEQWGARPERNESTITALLPSTEDAERLELDTGEPCLVIAAVAKSADNEVLEAGRSFYRADRHAVLARFHRPPGQPATTLPETRDAAAAMAGALDRSSTHGGAPLEPHM
jgi:GntR family transcriptional regulator